MAAATQKNPLRHRKRPFAHFTAAALGVSLGKSLLIRAIMCIETHDMPKLPKGGANMVKVVAQAVVPGMVKDVLVSSTARGIEHVVVQQCSLKLAGQLMRGMCAH
jgi:hypothetical protein